MTETKSNMTFLVMWGHCLHLMTLMASSIASMHLLIWDHWNEMQYDFFSYLTLLAMETASCDVNGNTVFIRSRKLKQCAKYLFSDVMPLMLVLVLHDANSVINHTFSFVRSRSSKSDATLPLWPYDAIGISISSMWCQCHHQWQHCIC